MKIFVALFYYHAKPSRPSNKKVNCIYSSDVSYLIKRFCHSHIMHFNALHDKIYAKNFQLKDNKYVLNRYKVARLDRCSYLPKVEILPLSKDLLDPIRDLLEKKDGKYLKYIMTDKSFTGCQPKYNDSDYLFFDESISIISAICYFFTKDCIHYEHEKDNMLFARSIMFYTFKELFNTEYKQEELINFELILTIIFLIQNIFTSKNNKYFCQEIFFEEILNTIRNTFITWSEHKADLVQEGLKRMRFRENRNIKNSMKNTFIPQDIKSLIHRYEHWHINDICYYICKELKNNFRSEINYKKCLNTSDKLQTVINYLFKLNSELAPKSPFRKY